MYASGWVMASVRIFSSVARLAVMVAMVPRVEDDLHIGDVGDRASARRRPPR